MPVTHDFTAKEDVLIMFWKSRRLPMKLVARLINWHCGKLYHDMGPLNHRARRIRYNEEYDAYLLMNDAQVH